MAAELKVYENSGCTTETLIRYENTIGVPLTGSSVIESPNQGGGNAPPDELTLDFTYDPVNLRWDCVVTRKDGTSYTKTGVTTNGNDVNYIIPGVSLAVATLNILNSYQAKVYIGWNPGIIVAGNSSAGKHLWVKNVGDANGSDARIRILPDGDFANVVNTPVRAINESKYQQNTAIGTYNVLVTALATKADVSYEGGDPVEVDIVADGATENELATGLWVVFNSGVADDDEANIYISDGKERVQIAEDSSGTPGTYGTSDAVFGNMNEGDTDSFWVKIVTQADDSPSGNPRHANLQARITTI